MRDRSLPMIPSQCCNSVVQRKRCKEFIFCLTHLQTLVVCLNIMLSILRIFPFLTEVDTRLIRNFDIFVVIRHLHQNGRISALFWMYNANAIYINQLICFKIKTLSEHFYNNENNNTMNQCSLYKITIKHMLKFPEHFCVIFSDSYNFHYCVKKLL